MFIIFSFILIGPAVSWKKKKKKKKENSEANSVPVKLERFINRVSFRADGVVSA